MKKNASINKTMMAESLNLKIIREKGPEIDIGRWKKTKWHTIYEQLDRSALHQKILSGESTS